MPAGSSGGMRVRYLLKTKDMINFYAVIMCNAVVRIFSLKACNKHRW